MPNLESPGERGLMNHLDKGGLRACLWGCCEGEFMQEEPTGCGWNNLMDKASQDKDGRQQAGGLDVFVISALDVDTT